MNTREHVRWLDTLLDGDTKRQQRTVRRHLPCRSLSGADARSGGDVIDYNILKRRSEHEASKYLP